MNSDEKFRVLRVRVQHEVALPAVVLVGAAMGGDGATYVACGLARAFAEAGHHTLLLDANPATDGVPRELGIVTNAEASNPQRLDRNLSVAGLYEREETVVADEELTEILSSVRSRYAVTVIDAPAIPGSGAALQLARGADGILLAVRLGRHASAEDHEMKQLLQANGLLGSKAFCGVVPTRAGKRRSPRPARALATVPSLSGIIGRVAGRAQPTSR